MRTQRANIQKIPESNNAVGIYGGIMIVYFAYFCTGLKRKVMEYSKICPIYYSPTGTSRKISEHVAFSLAGRYGLECGNSVMDFTHSAPDGEVEVRDTLAVVAAPVYGGRVAETAVRRLKLLKAENSAAVAVVLYGNRDYEDALVELADLLSGCGFEVIAAAAFVGEHSYSRPDEGMPLAQGRPDMKDMEIAERFALEIAAKLDAGKPEAVSGIKGNRPYKVKGAPTPQAPQCDAALCVKCAHCTEVCPVGAIEVTREGAVADSRLCTKCCACVKECPAGALRFDTPYTKMLFTNFTVRREPELFI